MRGELLARVFLSFLRERRYAELGYLLPFSIGPAVKNPVYRPFLITRLLQV